MRRAIESYAVRFMKRAYYRAQQGRCGICQKPMSKTVTGSRFGFDHTWPKSKSSLSGVDACHGNLTLCHNRCNGEKADRLPTEAEVKFLYVTNRMLGIPAHQTAIWDSPAGSALISKPIEIGANENEPEHQQRGDAAAQ